MLVIDKKRIQNFRYLLEDISYALLKRYSSEFSYNELPAKPRFFMRLFLLNEFLSVKEAKSFIGKKSYDDFLTLGLLDIKNNTLRSKYKIETFNHYYFLSENRGYHASEYAYIGEDSCDLAKNISFYPSCKKVLDLCTGTGIQAIVSSMFSRDVIGIELLPEVVNIAKFNVALNGLEKKVKILKGNLYGPVKDDRFDLIISNPPFIPVPNGLSYPVSGRGGEDGLLVLRRILNELEVYLNKNGKGLFLGITFGDKAHPFIFGLLEEIAKRDGLDVELLVTARIPKWQEFFSRSASLDIADRLDAFKKIKELYSDAGAEYLYRYFIKVRKIKGRVRQINLFSKRKINNRSSMSETTSLESLYFDFIGFYMDGKYKQALKISRNIEKLCGLFSLEYKWNIPVYIPIYC